MSSIRSELRYHSRKEGDVSSSLQAIDCAWEVVGDDNSLVNQQVLYFFLVLSKEDEMSLNTQEA